MGMIQHRTWTSAASKVTNNVPQGALAIAGLYFLSSASTFFWAYVPRQMSALGWTGVQVGAFFMLKTAGQALATPAWSRLADGRGKSGRHLLKLQYIVAAVAIALLPVAGSWTVGIIIALVLGTTMRCAPPLMDTMALGTVGMKRFGRIRAFGTMGFGIAALFFAMVGLRVDHGTLAGGASWAMLILVLVSLPIINRLPDYRTDSSTKPRRGGAKQKHRASRSPKGADFFKSPLVILVFPLAALFVATHIPYELFLVSLAEERNFGAWIPGVAIFVGIVGELLGFLSFRKMVKKISPEMLVGVIVAITGLRWMVTGITTSPIVFIGLQVLHGLTFAAFFMAMIEVMARHWGPTPGATSQGLLYLFVFAAGQGIGTMVSGVVYEKSAAINLFWQAGLATFVLLPCLLAMLYVARRYQSATASGAHRNPGRRFRHYPVPVPHRRPVRVALTAKAVAPLMAHRRPHHRFPLR